MTQNDIAALIASNPEIARQFAAAVRQQAAQEEEVSQNLIPDSMREDANEYILLTSLYSDVVAKVHEMIDPLTLTHTVQPMWDVFPHLLAPITHDLKAVAEVLPKSVRDHCDWLADQGATLDEGVFGVADSAVEPVAPEIPTVDVPSVELPAVSVPSGWDDEIEEPF